MASLRTNSALSTMSTLFAQITLQHPKIWNTEPKHLQKVSPVIIHTVFIGNTLLSLLAIEFVLQCYLPQLDQTMQCKRVTGFTYRMFYYKRENFQPVNYFHDFLYFEFFFCFNLLDDAAGKTERAVSCRKTFEYSKVKTSEYDREYILPKIKIIW